MTGIDDIVVGFAVSYLAGNIPAIAQLFESNNSLKKRIENCYGKALIRWSKNEHIRNNISDNYRTLDNLSKYIVKEDSFEREDIVCLMQLWTDELRKDDLCYKVILELKSDLTNKNLNNGFKDMGLELSIIKSEIIEAIERQKPSKPFYNASSGLRSCNSVVGNDYHIDRHETSEIYSWIVTPETEKNEPQDRICFLLGEAGCGKSVILRDVLIKLEYNSNYLVLGLKSDLLFDSSDVDIDKALNLGKPLLDIVREQASEKHIVIIIDQIDALSATLSANRKPIMIMNALINEISQVSNVRVVVSCRSYDFNYDASFEKYRNKTKIINVQKLNNSDIQNALKSTGLSEIYNKTLLDLLAIPINLFLYCRLRNRKMIDKNPTVQGLYDEIWKEIVVDRIVDDTKTSKDYLLSYLTEFTNKLVSKQVLSIKSNCMGTKYSNEQNYLISNNILSHDLNTDNVQFIHQSLLDYVYARLFFENKESLEKQFENVHQGLYVRARLKQVLEYQRQLDSDIYIKNVNTILFGINDGTPRYRFQLKHLVLSILASRNDLLECEEKLLLNKILPDTKLSKTYLSLIITECGFVLLRKYIGELGGFNSLGIDKQCEIVNVANNISNLSPKDVVEFLLEIDYSKLNIKVLNSLILLINYRLLITKENYHSIEDVVDKIDNDSALMPFSELYKKLIKYDFKKVENRISKHIESLENERDHQSFFDFDLSYDAKELIDELKKHDKEEWFNFALEIIKSLAEKSEIQLEDEILSSSAFYLYNRDNDHYHYHFNEVLLSDVLTEIEYKVKNKKISSQLLSNLSNSKYSVCHIIAIVGWIQNVEEYSESIYNYLHDNILKITHTSELGYYQRRLFGMSFDVFSNEQQDELLKIISKLSPDWEKVVIS